VPTQPANKRPTSPASTVSATTPTGFPNDNSHPTGEGLTEYSLWGQNDETRTKPRVPSASELVEAAGIEPAS